MSSAVSSTTYLILSPFDMPRLDEWRAAVAERFAGCLVKPVLIGGGPRDARKVQQYDCPLVAATYLSAVRRSSDRVFVLTVGDTDATLTRLVNGGLYPTYIDTTRYRPADLVAKSGSTAPQVASGPGLGSTRQAA